MPDTSETIENKTFDEIAVGDRASLSRTLTRDDIDLFAVVSGDINPSHVDQAFAGAAGPVAHSMWTGSLLSAVLGNELPGPGTVYAGQNLRFHRPVALGDTITARVTVAEKKPGQNLVVFDCLCTNQDGEEVVTGTAEVVAPAEKISRPRTALPEVGLKRQDNYRRLIERSRAFGPVITAVAHPCDQASLAGSIEAAEAGLITPILVGPEAKVKAVAESNGLDISPYRLIATEHSEDSAVQAVALVRGGEAEALMKGSLHTDELMRAVAKRDTGLRTGRRISHCFVMDVPTYDQVLIITDAAINIYPTLEDKQDICQNAIELAQALGIEEPRVAVLSAVETVTPKIPGTLEAAALCKMADRGQITGALLDGPLAFDNAINPQAAETKGIASQVAGRANILLVPDLEAGNMLAKNLTFMANADAAGIVLGARVPIILTSRADSVRTRMASCAVAVLVAEAQKAPAS
ncbi:MAG: bifunctional enoyl-CoA hydratase/phosphate acetyltransferase [Rhodospirillales bacterium]|nr:bifunctional enoyl-CoA hydratase/phosphate acetyltransferase [Rhodospirillales bacterium]MDH3911654.1 bifunctional enoyl-CoA hydratase/phosphate acetyltransferase [Rhodospirillales bacterium]MDH3968841.1 bifunctional enoyl-CoA hydratase/phosphate acetyltransferase [Rhodospirillales bacterium]